MAEAEENPTQPESDKSQKPTTQDKIMKEITERLEAAKASAIHLREEAESSTDPEISKAKLKEAARKEAEAKSELKIVQRLQSGVWQGGAGGLGIGAGVGMGIGAAVGTVVGGVASIPTGAVGLLAGMGTGAIHGPWFKMPSGGKEEGGEEKHDEVGGEKR